MWRLFLVFFLIWMFAFISMLAGNPTAVNAVVGIPMGMLVMWAVVRAVGD